MPHNDTTRIGRFEVDVDLLSSPEIQYLLSKMHILTVILPYEKVQMPGRTTIEIWAVFEEFDPIKEKSKPPSYTFTWKRENGTTKRMPAERV